MIVPNWGRCAFSARRFAACASECDLPVIGALGMVGAMKQILALVLATGLAVTPALAQDTPDPEIEEASA
ncbi:MAG: hypothetical protein ACSHW1_02095 [Yoonia sp.]